MVVTPVSPYRDTLTHAIHNAEYQGGATEAGKAWLKGLELLRSPVGPPRPKPNVTVWVLMTDGELAMDPDPTELAREAKARGEQVFTLGVGYQINTTQLKLMASSPDHYLTTDTFGGIVALMPNITSHLCDWWTCEGGGGGGASGARCVQTTADDPLAASHSECVARAAAGECSAAPRFSCNATARMCYQDPAGRYPSQQVCATESAVCGE